MVTTRSITLEYFEGDRIAPTMVSQVNREDLGWILLTIILKHGMVIERSDDRLVLRYPDKRPGMGDEYHALVG